MMGHQQITVSNPLVEKVDIISHVSTFTADDQFLFFGSVSTGWRRAWRKPSKTTRAVTADTSVPMLEHCFECGLGDSSAVCEKAARLGRLDLLQCARAHFCPFGETCTVAYNCAKNARTQEHYSAYHSLFRWARVRGCAWRVRGCAWKDPVSSAGVQQRGQESGIVMGIVIPLLLIVSLP